MAELDWWDKAVKELNLYWEVDIKQQQVRLKDQERWWKKLYLKWFKRFRVKELYAWMQSTWGSTQMMSHKTGIKHDDFKISKELEKIVPRGYQLQGGWSIRESDLKYLVGGPLLSEDGQRLLVRAQGTLGRFVVFLEKYYKPIRIALAVVAAVFAILTYFK